MLRVGEQCAQDLDAFLLETGLWHFLQIGMAEGIQLTSGSVGHTTLGLHQPP